MVAIHPQWSYNNHTGVHRARFEPYDEPQIVLHDILLKAWYTIIHRTSIAYDDAVLALVDLVAAAVGILLILASSAPLANAGKRQVDLRGKL